MLRELQAYNGHSGTACPSVSDWLNAFGDAEEIFGVALTSRLSGCYSASQIAANEYITEHPERKVFILDSLSAGPELELIIEKYSELICSNKTFEAICDEIKQYLEHTRLAFSLESLLNFAKNGRVNPVLAKAIGFLGIRIVGRASTEGDLEPQHKCRGENTALQKLLHTMLDEGFSGGKVRIRHSENPEAAEKLAMNIKSIYPSADIKIGQNHGLCSYYAEKGGVLVGYEV